MRQPWQIWLVFLLGLAVVFPAMGWLSIKTVELDALREADREETELARQEAELQERISSALYRMDLKMLPLVAQEAARPHYYYNSFYQVTNPALASQTGGLSQASELEDGLGGSDADTQLVEDPNVARLPSPLLFSAPNFVLLHFQVGPNQIISSPQRPVGVVNDLARFDYGVSQAAIDVSELRLRQASQLFNYDLLLKECPTIDRPQVAEFSQDNVNPRTSVYNVPAVEKLKQLILDSKSGKKILDDALVQSLTGNKAQVQRSRGESRVNTEFEKRLDSTKDFADQQWAASNAYENVIGNPSAQQSMPFSINDSLGIREGVMQPRWVGEDLVLLRRVDGKDTPLVQGCWLDWPAIRSALKAEVADLLPTVEFQPVRVDSDLNVGTALTTIPVQLVVDSSSLLSTLAIESRYDSKPTSGLRMSLWVAWMGLALAAIASASLLYGVIRLSERRAAFVSAVTHELRTPLTTFRMYAEMLAEKMVPEAKQQEYANTLRVQADRLSHLVENVLQFARLERGGGSNNHETVKVDDLFGRFATRLVDRATGAEMDLTVKIDEAVAELEISTQPSTIEQIVFNLVDNACKYAKPSDDTRIEVVCSRRSNYLRFCVRDHGPGVSAADKKRMFKPFCKSDQDATNTAAGVGLGLALCKRMATSLGGRLFHEEIKGADVGSGAMFVFELPITR